MAPKKDNQDMLAIAKDELAYRMHMMEHVGSTDKAIEVLETNQNGIFKRLGLVEKTNHTHDHNQRPHSTTYSNGNGEIPKNGSNRRGVLAAQGAGVVGILWVVKEIIVVILNFSAG